MGEVRSPRALDLSGLLAPLTVEGFLAETWEQSPLHLHREDATTYDALLSNADLERILSSTDLRYPAVQLARHGGYFPPEAYTRSVKHGTEVFAGVPDLEKVRSEYRSGATIVLPALHRTWGPLRELCASMEQFFSHAVHANAYLTAANTTGFTPHYDTHEVFVLQIGGKKRWSVYAPPLALPHRSQPFVRGANLGAPILEVELSPGDLLYLPRGTIHAAATSGSHSAHVTLGVTVYTWVELLSEWVLASKDLPVFRKALPVGFANRDDLHALLKAGLKERVAELAESADLDSVLTSFRARIRAQQPRPPVPFRADVTVIGPATTLQTPESQRYVVGTENGNTTLELDGRKLMLPAGVRQTLDAMCALRSFRVGDLPKHLDNHATFAFAQFLQGEGFLTVAR